MLPNRRFYVELNKERSKSRNQKNGLPIHDGRTRSFIYADDLCITAQYQSFKQVEETNEDALDNLSTYYKMNSRRANPETLTLKEEILYAHKQKDEMPSAHNKVIEKCTVL